MKNFIKLAYAFVALTLASVACMKEQNPYQPAEPATGEQVFFPNTIASQISLDKDATSFDIPVFRNATALEAVDVAIEASGEGADIFSVPGTVSFQSGSKESKITIDYNPEDLPTNVFYSLTLKISDEGLTTPYGNATLTISAGVALPWVAFDEGIIYETPYWGEQEEKTLYYQQISETIRFCRVPECFGYETMKAGEPYDVQDYTFYWNTETNQIYVPKQWMGYANSNGETWFMDESEFYNWYWEGYGYAPGTDEWFAFCDLFRSKYPGDYYPYYDGNGGFFLADYYTAGEPGTSAYLGRYTGGVGDSFICNSFVRKDFTSSVEYGGMFVDPDDNAAPIINFGGTKDVAGLKYVVTGQDVDPEETLALIVADESEDIKDITLNGGKASVQLDLEVGTYRIVAVPYGEDGTLQPNDAVKCDFYFPGANADKPEVEAELMLMSGTEVFSEATIQEKGTTDYNSMGYVLYGKEIKSGKYYMNEASVIATWTDPLEDLVAAYGSDISANSISSINTKGYTAGGWTNGLKASTEYQMIVVLENVYGSKLTLTASHTTADLPYQGELVVGTYTIDCSQPAYGTITVAPTEDETKFIVYDIAIPNGSGWNAVYDSAKNTLTCDGTEYGYEEDGNMFGVLYGYWNQARTQAYAIDVYSNDDSDGTEPIVFDVDPTTHQLTKIHPNVDLDVFNLSDESYVGTANSIVDGATVTYVPTNDAVRTVNKASVTFVPTNNAVRTVNKASVNKAYRPLKASRFESLSGFDAETRSFDPIPFSSKEWSTGSMKVKGNGKKNLGVSKVVEKF